MGRLFGRPAAIRYVHMGSVHCPRRGRDVEIDVCAGCESLADINLVCPQPYVRCEAVPVTFFHAIH
jgi:hypothetical protein